MGWYSHIFSTKSIWLKRSIRNVLSLYETGSFPRAPFQVYPLILGYNGSWSSDMLRFAWLPLGDLMHLLQFVQPASNTRRRRGRGKLGSLYGRRIVFPPGIVDLDVGIGNQRGKCAPEPQITREGCIKRANLVHRDSSAGNLPVSEVME